MAVIKGRGKEAKEFAKSRMDKKENRIMLKDGESIMVYVPSVEEYVAYSSRGDYNLGIFDQPVDEDSPLAVAHDKGGEKFEKLFEKTRYLMMFVDVEKQMPVGFMASPNQFKNIISTIEEYDEQEVLHEQPFKLSRTGKGNETVYKLEPVLSKKKDLLEKFEQAKEVEIKFEYYEELLEPNQDKFVAKLLDEAGFNVATHLPHIDITDDSDEALEVDDSEELESSDDLLEDM